MAALGDDRRKPRRSPSAGGAVARDARRGGRAPWWSSPRVHAAALIVLVLAAYAGSTGGDFVSDDVSGIRNNEKVHALDWPHVKRMLTTFFDANYLPVTVLSLAVDYRLWGARPAGFHATNLVLHALCALLVCALLRRLGLPPLGALAVAALWATHPLQVESVAWISERKNVLSGLFFFAAFYVYLRFSESPGFRDGLAVLALFALAVLSKMNTLVLPAVCLAYEAAFRFRLRRRDLLAALPLFGVGALVAWVNLSGSGIHGGPYHGGSAVVTWLSSSVVVFRYLGKILVPVHLASYYDVVLRDSLLDPAVAAAVLGILLAVGASVVLALRKRREGFWILWFFIALAPMLNIVPFRSMMQDRYVYLASLGPLALVGTAVVPWLASSTARRVALAAAGAAILGCVALSHARVRAWSDDLAFYEALAPEMVFIPEQPPYVTPEREERIAFLRDLAGRRPSAVVESNLGSLYYTAGRNDEAIAHLEAAARLDPDHPRIQQVLGYAYLRAGRIEDARRVLERSVRLGPYDGQAWGNLAIARLLDGDRPGAIEATDACLRIQGNRDLILRWLGFQLEQYREAWKGRPEPSAPGSGPSSP